MVLAALRSLTWGTVAAAVVSALLLASSGGTMPRIASLTADAVRAGAARPGLAGSQSTAGNGAQGAAALVPALPSH